MESAMGLLNWEGLPEEGERGGRGSHGEIRKGCILGERNSQWKGSEVGTEEGSIHGQESRSSPEGWGRGGQDMPMSLFILQSEIENTP